MSAEPRLTDAQDRAIDAVLEHETREAAATAAKVSPRSLFRWLKSPVFQTELARRRTRLLSVSADILARGAAGAARALVRMSEGTLAASQARTAAAKAVMDLVRKSAEVDDIGIRLAELEAASAAQERPASGSPLRRYS